MSKLLWPVLCFLILLGGCAPGYSTRESRSVYPKYWGEYTGPGVAIDAVAAKIMGIDPMGIKYIRLAHEKGLGVGDPREIEIVGDTDVANENWGFKVRSNFHGFLAWLAWYGPTKFLQPLIMRTPLVAVPIFVSEFGHDHLQWPLRFKQIAEDWQATTPWGQLFTRYQKEGYLGEPQELAAHSPNS